MKETRLSSMYSSLLPLEYQEAGGETLALPLVMAPTAPEPPPSVPVGVPEDEVERRIQIARDAVIAETNQRLRDECERATKSAQAKIAEVIREFCEERSEYFKRVEGVVVQLALSVARKILQREAKLDPTLLVALVRVALDRMQCGSEVYIRVPVDDTELWRDESSACWKIIGDETLNAGDCVVETDLGTANFGFESQLRDVEESFMQLLAHRPNDRIRHAATA
jgi:flagellar assembly protein FliH